MCQIRPSHSVLVYTLSASLLRESTILPTNLDLIFQEFKAFKAACESENIFTNLSRVRFSSINLLAANLMASTSAWYTVDSSANLVEFEYISWLLIYYVPRPNMVITSSGIGYQTDSEDGYTVYLDPLCDMFQSKTPA